MKKKCCGSGLYIPLTELRQQINYARTVSADIKKIYFRRTPSITELLNEYSAVRNKISMLEDFLFQAALWCDTILPDEVKTFKDDEETIKEEE